MPRLAGPHPAHTLRLAADRKAAGPETAAAGSADSPATRTLDHRRSSGRRRRRARRTVRHSAWPFRPPAHAARSGSHCVVRADVHQARPGGSAPPRTAGSRPSGTIRRNEPCRGSVAMTDAAGARARAGRGHSARPTDIAAPTATERQPHRQRRPRAKARASLTSHARRTEPRRHRAPRAPPPTGANRAQARQSDRRQRRTNRLRPRRHRSSPDRSGRTADDGCQADHRRPRAGRAENHRAAGVGHARRAPSPGRRTSDRPVGSRRECAEPQTAEIHARELDGERAGHLLDAAVGGPTCSGAPRSATNPSALSRRPKWTGASTARTACGPGSCRHDARSRTISTTVVGGSITPTPHSRDDRRRAAEPGDRVLVLRDLVGGRRALERQQPTADGGERQAPAGQPVQRRDRASGDHVGGGERSAGRAPRPVRVRR